MFWVELMFLWVELMFLRVELVFFRVELVLSRVELVILRVELVLSRVELALLGRTKMPQPTPTKKAEPLRGSTFRLACVFHCCYYEHNPTS